MAKPAYIELTDGLRVPVLHEDRAVLAIDKPAGWMLVPVHWRQTGRNLQAALESGILAGAYWARARNLKFLRHVHRLDADTSGVLLLATSRGALSALSRLFESRSVEKRYLAVVKGCPRLDAWSCQSPLAAEPDETGRVRVDDRQGRPAETEFRVLARREDPRWGAIALVEARPLTGRTHQIRVHLAQGGHPVMGDPLYGPPKAPTLRSVGSGPSTRSGSETKPGLALRAVLIEYTDPFRHGRVRIEAPRAAFLATFGFPAEGPGAAGAQPASSEFSGGSKQGSAPATMRTTQASRRAR